jgi:hypothetical protein
MIGRVAQLGCLLLLSVIATLPGWLPRRVYVPAGVSDLQSAEAREVATMTFAAAQWRRGEPPLWNPQASGAEAVLERSGNGATSISLLPLVWLPARWGWVVAVVVALGLAGFGVSVLAERLGASPWHAMAAGAVSLLIFASFSAAGHGAIGNLVPCLPWCFVATAWVVRRPTLARTLVASLAFGAQFLTGDIAAAAWTSTTSLIFAAALAIRYRSLIGPAAVLLAMVGGLGLAGAQALALWHARAWITVGMGDLTRAGAGVAIVAGCLGLGAILWRFTPRDALIGVAVLMAILLTLAIWRHPGISVAAFQSAASRGSATPIVRAIPRALWTRTRAKALAEAAEPSFDPTQLVILDDEIYPDAVAWLDRVLTDRHKPVATNQPQSVYAKPPKLDAAVQDGNQARVTATTSGSGWIVFEAPYADGWTARLQPLPRFGVRGPSREKLVLPASGRFRAVRYDEGDPAEVTFEYRPQSFQRGVFVSSVTAVLLVLLFGYCAVRQRQTRDSEPARPQAGTGTGGPERPGWGQPGSEYV